MRFSDLKKLKPVPQRPAENAMPAPAPAPEKPAAPVPPPAEAPAAQLPPEQAAPARPEGRKRDPGPRLMNSQEPAAPERVTASFAEQDARAREIYSRLLAQASSFLKAVDQPYCEKYEALLAASALTAETLRSTPLFLGYSAYSTADDYLRGHTANTAMLALAMGLEAGLDSRELGLLGFCAMAHDIGMTEYSSLYNCESRLGSDEFSEMSLHVEAGAAKLDRIVDIDYKIKERARRIILQTHERADGSGYPDRLSDEELDPLARIISIADSYEAMTHPRAWRPAMPPHEAIKELIEKEGRGFNSGAVKLLISALSIYPPGSLVLLSTGEAARVLMPNKGVLTRPLVEIALAPDFSQTDPRTLDLKKHPLVSIERGLAAAELDERNPRYAAMLELSRWWKDW